jgi:hypothetical protein
MEDFRPINWEFHALILVQCQYWFCFWVMALCRYCIADMFGGPYSLHLQGWVSTVAYGDTCNTGPTLVGTALKQWQVESETGESDWWKGRNHQPTLIFTFIFTVSSFLPFLLFFPLPLPSIQFSTVLGIPLIHAPSFLERDCPCKGPCSLWFECDLTVSVILLV